MAFTIKGPTTASSTSNPGVLTFSEPSGTLSTDGLVMFLLTGAQPSTWTPSGGTWSQPANCQVRNTNGSAQWDAWVWQPGQTGGADGGANVGTGGTYTVTASGSFGTQVIGILFAISGAALSSWINATASTNHDSTTAPASTMTAPAATATVANSMVINLFASFDATSTDAAFGAPSGNTNIGGWASQAAGGGNGGASWRNQTATGTTGTTNLTSGSISFGWAAFTLVIAPAAGGGATFVPSRRPDTLAEILGAWAAPDPQAPALRRQQVFPVPVNNPPPNRGRAILAAIRGMWEPIDPQPPTLARSAIPQPQAPPVQVPFARVGLLASLIDAWRAPDAAPPTLARSAIPQPQAPPAQVPLSRVNQLAALVGSWDPPPPVAPTLPRSAIPQPMAPPQAQPFARVAQLAQLIGSWATPDSMPAAARPSAVPQPQAPPVRLFARAAQLAGIIAGWETTQEVFRRRPFSWIFPPPPPALVLPTPMYAVVDDFSTSIVDTSDTPYLAIDDTETGFQ